MRWRHIDMRTRAVAALLAATVAVACSTVACSSSSHHSATKAGAAPSSTIAGAEPALPPPQKATTRAVPPGPRAKVLFSVRTHDRVVFVTIDDGFVRDRRIVEFIREHHWPISAFVIDRLAVSSPTYFRRLMAAGATLDDHTYTHPDLATLGYESQRDQICRATHDFPRLFGVKPVLFRPPYGAYDDATRRAAEACGFSALIEWTGTVANGVLKLAVKRSLHPGDILLLHFTPSLYTDLELVAARLAAAHLTVGRLEDYVTN